MKPHLGLIATTTFSLVSACAIVYFRANHEAGKMAIWQQSDYQKAQIEQKAAIQKKAIEEKKALERESIEEQGKTAQKAQQYGQMYSDGLKLEGFTLQLDQQQQALPLDQQKDAAGNTLESRVAQAKLSQIPGKPYTIFDQRGFCVGVLDASGAFTFRADASVCGDQQNQENPLLQEEKKEGQTI